MDIDSIRRYCLSFPHATEDIQWKNDLLFRIGRKMFAAYDLNSKRLSFKCTPEKFVELTEQEGIIPAPYSARYHWVAVERPDALSVSEIEELIKKSYDMVFAKLPKKVRATLVHSTIARKKG